MRVSEEMKKRMKPNPSEIGKVAEKEWRKKKKDKKNASHKVNLLR